MTHPEPDAPLIGQLSVLAAGRPAGSPARTAPPGFRPYQSTGHCPPFGAGTISETSPRRLTAVLAAMIVILAVLVGTGAAIASATPDGTARAVWTEALRSPTLSKDLQAILDRRAAAVRARDKAAFMADVDTFDETFVRRQEVVFDNLVQLPLSEFSYVLEPTFGYGKAIADQVAARFRQRVYAPGVTIRYSVTGVDSKVVTTPWVPVFGCRGDRWVIAEDGTATSLPYGVNGQVWDAGTITVARSERVVAVFSAGDTGRMGYVLQLAEQGLDRVRAVRRGGWDGKVLVTAVQDQRIFDTYFATSPDRVAQVAAIAVPYYDRVVEWHANGVFATTRVVFNPQQLSAQPEELAHDLAHEFAHAAMGPVTVTATPRWLVEGFAEYVAYKHEDIPAAALRRSLRGTALPTKLPEDDTFYADSSNYITAWLACKMIVEKYGESRLIALYESFQRVTEEDINVGSVLGISHSTLVRQWRDYMQRRLG
ncbi:MAG: hypothetical protein JXA67_00125 [Micromonosporaceae bacterium]|nr:hypothetical protein [Micromonosporaceae bacterium]